MQRTLGIEPEYPAEVKGLMLCLMWGFPLFKVYNNIMSVERVM